MKIFFFLTSLFPPWGQPLGAGAATGLEGEMIPRLS